MDRVFMEKIFDKLYEDPIHEIVEKNKQYKDLMNLRSALQSQSRVLLDDKAMKLHDEIIDVINLQEDIIAREMYLKGMDDRNNMLK